MTRSGRARSRQGAEPATAAGSFQVAAIAFGSGFGLNGTRFISKCSPGNCRNEPLDTDHHRRGVPAECAVGAAEASQGRDGHDRRDLRALRIRLSLRAALRLRPQPLRGYPIPAANARFLAWAVVGGISQIAATALLIHLFSFRNFAVGTAYSRTEPAQAALFGLLFLGETVTPGVITAIAISVFGVMLISVAHTGGRLALAAALACHAQCADRPGVRHAVRRLGGCLSCRVAGARRPELHDAGGRDAGLCHHLPDGDHVRLDGLQGPRRDRPHRPRLEAGADRRPGRALRPRSAGSWR